MKQPVTTRDALLPVLVECRPGKKEEGFVLDADAGQRIAVRALPLKTWDSFRDDKRWKRFCDEYGTVSPQERGILMALGLLSQAIQTDSVRIFKTEPDQIMAAPPDYLKQYVKIVAKLRAEAKVPVPFVEEGKEEEEWSKEDVQAEEVWNQLLPPNGDPFAELSEKLGERTKSGRLVMWYSRRDKMLQAGLYFKTFADALYALFSLQVAMPEGVGFCERCGKVFKRSRVAQKFCSTKCGNYIRKKRERAAEKQQEVISGTL